MYDATFQERRLTRRAPVRSTVRLLEGDEVIQQHAVGNLSVGGALLLGRCPYPRGAALRMVLELPQVTLRLYAHVVRVQPDAFAIEFDWLTPVDEDAIHAAVLGALLPVASRRAGVLVVERAPGSRAAIAQDLAARGHLVIEAATPLEAVTRLREQSIRPIVTFVSAAFAGGGSHGLTGVLKETYPGMKLVILSAENALEQVAAVASAIEPRVGTRAAAEAVLVT